MMCQMLILQKILNSNNNNNIFFLFSTNDKLCNELRK